MSKLTLMTMALGAAVLGASVANANPITLSYSTDGGTTIVPFVGGSSTDGTSSISTTITSATSTYSVNFSGTGTPILTAPDFFSNTITVDSTGSGTLILYATETGLTTPSIANFSIGFVNNGLSNTSVVEAFQVNGTSILTQTMAPNTTSTTLVPSGMLPSNYSITQVYTMTFSGAAGRVNANISEAGVVPEPMSIALLGSGLVGMGIARRKRR